jgi:pyruvate, water dikinase
LKKISPKSLKMNVIIQRMVEGEVSGVLFQKDPRGKDQQVIIACPGLASGIVKDQSDSDFYAVRGSEILESVISTKKFFLTSDGEKLQIVKEKLDPRRSVSSSLNQGQIQKILTVSNIISSNCDESLDIEFTFQGEDLYVLQARPITCTEVSHRGKSQSGPSISGIPCTGGLCEGSSRQVSQHLTGDEVKGKILIAQEVEEAWKLLFCGIKGLIVGRGNLLSHASIITRELGIPCIIQVPAVYQTIPDGTFLQMDGDSGQILLKTEKA